MSADTISVGKGTEMLRNRDWRGLWVFALVFPAVVLAGSPSSKPAVPPLTPEKLFKQASGAVAKVLAFDKRNKLTKQGTGFFVSADGLLVTNAHVVAGAKTATVELPGGKPLRVVGVVAVSETNDIVILKVDANDLPFLKLSTAPPKQGQKVYAIGNPRGLTNTISDGLISGIRKVATNITRLQISVPIAAGSSGGPLLDSSGLVVGVTTSAIRGVGNLNFAVPASVVADLLGKAGKPVPLAKAGIRVGRTPAPPQPELPKIAATRKADGTTVVKAVMKAYGELILQRRKLTRMQFDEAREKIAKMVDGADLTFTFNVADVSFNEKTGKTYVSLRFPYRTVRYFLLRGVRQRVVAPEIGLFVIERDKRRVRWALERGDNKEWIRPEVGGGFGRRAGGVRLVLTREEAAKLKKGTVLQLSGPARVILPKGTIPWDRQRYGPGLRLYIRNQNTRQEPCLAINIPRFRLTLGTSVLYADPWLAEKKKPEPTSRKHKPDDPKESARLAVRKCLATSEMFLTIPNFDKAELHARKARKVLDANRKFFTAEEYAKELSAINGALKKIESKRRAMHKATRSKGH
ncbi:MAG: trypsin-like peptidase domain-containing protein [Phycisphaerae bacterium]|nr:trypsin-like peptidase domain-containing protein [Phycisphaerae bacterium]